MEDLNFDANEITMEDIESFLNSDGGVTSAPDTGETQTEGNLDEDTNQKDVSQTKAFANRLRQATDKAVKAEREKLAKDLGYDSYAELQTANERDLLREHGVDPESVKPLIDQLVEKRMTEDPRFKELEEVRQKKIDEWAKKELQDLKDLTGGKVTKLDDLSDEVLNLWKKEGSLKKAYMAIEGENLVKDFRLRKDSQASQGNTSHLESSSSKSSNYGGKGVRQLNREEREVYQIFHPNMTEEELNKITVEIK